MTNILPLPVKDAKVADLELNCQDTSCYDCPEFKYCNMENPSWEEVFWDIKKNPDKYWK